jgi:hypothetical protein
MTLRNCLSASLLFCLFASLAAAQGTPGGKTEILKGFTPLSEQDLKKGKLSGFDNTSTFGWQGDVKVENGKLYFTGKWDETPFWYFASRAGNPSIGPLTSA